MKLIVEPNSPGHRLWHVRLLIEECRSKGDKVAVLTTKSAVESAEWLVHLGDCAPHVILRPPHEFTLPIIARVAAGLEASLTILLDADRHLLSVFRRGWTGPGKLTVLIMSADVHPGPPLSWMRPAKTLVKKALVLGAGLWPRVRIFALRSPLVPRRGPLHWIADPVTLRCSVEEKQAMRAHLDSYGDRYWLGVFGAIGPRKNLPLVVEAILDEPGVGLLIAGSVDPKVSETVAPILANFTANGGQVVQLRGPLTDAALDSAIGVVDCVIVAHSTEGSSGVVLKAAASGRRLVLAGAKSLLRDAAHLGDQAIWSPLETDRIRHAVRQTRSSTGPAPTVELTSDEFRRSLTLE